MLFCSMSFIYLFLPVLCGLYFVCNKKYHNILLFLASIIFYAWGEPRYLPVIFFVVLINWAGALAVDKCKGSLSAKKICLIFTLLINLGNLFYFKYFDFFVNNLNGLFHTHINLLNVVLPLGISFYTFQALSYVIDVYRGNVSSQKNLFKVALYICLFPQLVAGPIIKYHDIADQIDSREVNFDNVNIGIKRFIIGLSKKMLIANTMGAVADKIFMQDVSSFNHITAWLGSFAYTFQIYYDFSGYSDMAIGLGLIFGFRFMENFNYPYISKSITEFWRRWHISLSTWFKEYVYIPLGGNRHGKYVQIRNLGIVFLLTGIWHGASWTFIVWGVWHGSFIILEKIFNFEKTSSSLFSNILKHIYAVIVISAGWVIFRADNLSYAIDYLKNMFFVSSVDSSKILYLMPYYADKFDIIIFVAAVICSVPLFRNMLNRQNKYVKILVNFWLVILFVSSTAVIVEGTYNPFIYFRF